MAKPPFRFSLASMLLLSTIVCLIVSLWSASESLQQAKEDLKAAEAQIHDYRSELGYLNIVDSSKLHLARVPLPGSLKWQWRLHVPEEKRFTLNLASQWIPKDEVSKMRGGAMRLPAGEVTVHASVHQDHNGDRVFRVEVLGDSAVSTGMEGPHATWLDGGGYSTSAAGSGGTEAANTGETAVLLRLRAHEKIDRADANGGISTKDGPTDEPGQGLMIWITDSKESDEEPAVDVSDGGATKDSTRQGGPSR